WCYSPFGSPDPWAATTKIGSSAWAEGWVLEVRLLSSGRVRAGQRRGGSSHGPRRVQEEVSAEESVAQPQGAPAAAVAGGQQQQEYQPQPQQYADWFPMAEQFFRNLYQGAWQPRQVAAGGQPPVPPPAVPEQQADLEVEQPAVQQPLGTGSTRAGQRRTTVIEDRTALLERFLRLRPPMFFGEYDPDKAES
ncbi:hypothetical protein Taro_007329, partial [Colocasia esculenta]|nr:hypothetical protein [Colocasia esculenta]